MGTYAKGQTVYGVNAGTFIIKEFVRVADGGVEGARLKEVDPVTGREGPHPEVFHTFDMFQPMPRGRSASRERMPTDEELLKAILPVIAAREYNPNKSQSRDTLRTVNVRGTDLDTLREIYHRLGG